MKDAGFFLLFVFIVILGIVWTFGRHGKAEEMLQEWCRRNGYSLLSFDRKWFFKGPFFWTAGKNQLVYQITVGTPEGGRRTGYAKVGSYIVGLLSDQVLVRWDDE